MLLYKSYLKEKNTGGFVSMMQQLQKLKNIFSKDHSDNLTTISFVIDIAQPIGKLRGKPLAIKQKQTWLVKANGAYKCLKKSWNFETSNTVEPLSVIILLI